MGLSSVDRLANVIARDNAVSGVGLVGMAARVADFCCLLLEHLVRRYTFLCL